jgi:hypothetical protein
MAAGCTENHSRSTVQFHHRYVYVPQAGLCVTEDPPRGPYLPLCFGKIKRLVMCLAILMQETKEFGCKNRGKQANSKFPLFWTGQESVALPFIIKSSFADETNFLTFEKSNVVSLTKLSNKKNRT